MLGRIDWIRQQLLTLPRRQKRLLQVAVDVVLVWLALWLAFVVRLGDYQEFIHLGAHAWVFITAPMIALPLFIRFGMYRAVMRYLGNDALIAIAKAVACRRCCWRLAVYWFRNDVPVIPRSMVFNYWWLTFC